MQFKWIHQVTTANYTITPFCNGKGKSCSLLGFAREAQLLEITFAHNQTKTLCKNCAIEFFQQLGIAIKELEMEAFR